MDLLFVLGVSFIGFLIPCECIEFMDIILNDTDIEQEWTTSDQETEDFVKNIKFLKLLPLNKEWKSKISDSSVQSDNKKMESVPIVLILATAGGSEEIRDSTEPEASVDEKSIFISNEDVENIKEEDDYQIIDPNVSLKTNPEVEDSVKKIEETVDHVVREELRTTVQPINDQDVNIQEIDKEDITELDEIKNDIDEALSDCKKDKNCKFTPDDDSSEITEDLFVSQEKYSLEDSDHSLVKDEKSLDKSYKLSIVINKYIIVK